MMHGDSTTKAIAKSIMYLALKCYREHQGVADSMCPECVQTATEMVEAVSPPPLLTVPDIRRQIGQVCELNPIALVNFLGTAKVISTERVRNYIYAVTGIDREMAQQAIQRRNG